MATKVVLVKLHTGDWVILREDGKLGPKHEFHHNCPMKEIKEFCVKRKLEIIDVLAPDWTGTTVTHLQ